ncbi:hypothetical protein WJX84_010562 [Apatococcus fuscideae]|uniref:DNA endonuclease activator Ctp1 C-terminal domain-containing protein n=1 Tax=Apatococcus fuscideae TaxID=2026836 RepID=A0AAW1SXY2_9CHLO
MRVEKWKAAYLNARTQSRGSTAGVTLQVPISITGNSLNGSLDRPKAQQHLMPPAADGISPDHSGLQRASSAQLDSSQLRPLEAGSTDQVRHASAARVDSPASASGMTAVDPECELDSGPVQPAASEVVQSQPGSAPESPTIGQQASREQAAALAEPPNATNNHGKSAKDRLQVVHAEDAGRSTRLAAAGGPQQQDQPAKPLQSLTGAGLLMMPAGADPQDGATVPHPNPAPIATIIEAADTRLLERNGQLAPQPDQALSRVPEGVLAAEDSGSACQPEHAAADARRLPPAQHGAEHGGQGYKYNETVRKRADREALSGFDCPDCRGFYEAMASWGHLKISQLPSCGHAPLGKRLALDRGETFTRKQIQDAASRHRAKYRAPETPDGFWDMGFGDSLDSRVHS